MITLATASSDAYAPLAAISNPGKQEYCQRWGLNFSHRHHPEPVTCWQRPEIWADEMKRCEWLFWLGCDTLITNMTIDVRSLISDDDDLVIAIDGNGLQSDSFIIRSTPRTIAMMEKIARHEDCGTNNEQDGMNIELSGAKDYNDYCRRIGDLKQGGEPPPPFIVDRCSRELNRSGIRVKIVPQRKLNAYPHELYGGTGSEEHSWHPGDFVLHAPGVPNEIRLRTFPNYPITR